LAPTQEILARFKEKAITWSEYEHAYLKLIRERRVESTLRPDDLDDACLLCSEAEPHRCHRRLAAEYLRSCWRNVQINHL
jgi:hypothetical protein